MAFLKKVVYVFMFVFFEQNSSLKSELAQYITLEFRFI